MHSEIFRKYSIFSFLSILLSLGLIIFSTQTNYFFKNFVFIILIYTASLICFSGIYKSGSLKRYLGFINAVDAWFFADLSYNIFSITYSHVPRVSVEECFYQAGYFLVYVMARFFVVENITYLEKTLKFFCVVSLVFVCRILYIVFFKFQLIGTDGRISHDSMHPNLLASFILIAISFYIYFLIKNIMLGAAKVHIALLAMPVTLYLYTIFMTSSRGGMLGFTLAALVVSFLYLKNSGNLSKFKYALMIVAATGLLLTALNYNRVHRVFWESGLSALRQRGEIWNEAAKLFLENPVFGVGASVCSYSIQKISASSMVDAHNFMLQKLCDLGVTGTFIYLMPLLLVLRKAMSAAGRAAGGSGAHVSALGYSVIFVIISVFANSMLSPHYILPTISLYLYLLIGIFVSADQIGVQIKHRDQENERFLLRILLTVSASAIFYIIFKLISVTLGSEIYFELNVWQKPLALFFGIFFYSFYLSNKFGEMGHDGYEPALPAEDQLQAGYMAPRKFFAVSLVVLPLIFAYPAAHFFIAEKANTLAMNSAAGYSMKNSGEYFDIAIGHDPSNVSYLINKSYLLFMSGFIKNNVLKGNRDIKNSLELMERAEILVPHDVLVKSALTFLQSKYNGESDYKTLKSDRKAKKLKGFNADVNEQLLIQSYFNAFSKFVDIFGDEGYSVFIKANEGLHEKILAIMREERDIRPGTRLTPYFDYISFGLKLGVNIDLPNIDKFLITGVYSAMKGVDRISEFIPVSGFRERSNSFTQQNELLAAVSMILPVIWKYSSGMDSAQIKKQFSHMFGSDSLFPVVDYFLFNNNAALKEFSRYDGVLKDYLESMVHFSNGSFEVAVKSQEAAFRKNKGFSTLNSVMMSWVYYKAGDLAAARSIALYCQTHMLANSKRDLTFKRDILYGGNMHSFYYLPLQAYYNEFIMLALIRLNGGDHTKVIYEVFKYLRTVIYVE